MPIMPVRRMAARNGCKIGAECLQIALIPAKPTLAIASQA